jgi:hypothetical protein
MDTQWRGDNTFIPAARTMLQQVQANRPLPAVSIWELASAAAYGPTLQRDSVLSLHKDDEAAGDAAMEVRLNTANILADMSVSSFAHVCCDPQTYSTTLLTRQRSCYPVFGAYICRKPRTYAMKRLPRQPCCAG